MMRRFSILIAGLLTIILWSVQPAIASDIGCHVPGTELANSWIPILPSEILFEDGFESGTFDSWQEAHGFTIQSDDTASGEGAAVATSEVNSNWMQLQLEKDRGSIRLESEFNVQPAIRARPLTLVEFRSVERAILSIVVDDAGRLGVQADGKIRSIDVVIADGQWHTLQTDLRPGGKRTDSIQLWLDQATSPQLTANSFATYARITDIRIGAETPDDAFGFTVDDIKVAGHTSRQLDNLPAMLEFHTVPPIEQMNVELQGCRVLTGEDGTGQITLDYLDADYRSRITFHKNVQAEGVRYEGGQLYWRGEGLVKVAVSTIYQVGWQFVDRSGNRIESASIDKMTVKSSIGGIHEYDSSMLAYGDWLKGRRVVPGQSELLEKEIYYTIQSVEINGQNVVNRSQQKFFPSEEQDWEIELLFYPGTFQVRDALFGFELGSAIYIEYPDGQRERHELHDGQTSLLLPRGDYEVTVDGWGLGLSRPLAMTRAQDVNLQLISYLDILVILCIVALVLTAPVLAGRPWLAHRLVNRGGNQQSHIRASWRIRGVVLLAGLLAATLLFSILITRNRLPDTRSSQTVTITTPVAEED